MAVTVANGTAELLTNRIAKGKASGIHRIGTVLMESLGNKTSQYKRMMEVRGDGMTDTERVIARLKKLVKAAHNENYDFVYIPVGTARVIIRLLEERETPKDQEVRE